MKKTDIAMIVLVSSMSVLIAYFVVSALPMFSVKQQQVKVKVADPIETTVDEPDTTVFNKDAINPTVEVIIGGDNSAEPTPESTDEGQ